LKLTGPVAQALVNLRGSTDFSTVLEWLKENKAKDMDTCVNADGLQLHRAQGRAKALDEIQSSYDEAPSMLQKIKSNL